MDTKNLTTKASRLEMTGTNRRRKTATEQQVNADIAPLPGGPDSTHCTPKNFLRTTLFSEVHSKDRVYIDGKILSSHAGTTVKFTGEQLNQEDLVLWETLMRMAKDHPLGTSCTFTAHEILEALSFPSECDQHEHLHKGIVRLIACAAEITHEGKTYFGSPINSGAKDDLTSRYTLELNRNLIRLYRETQWTAIDLEQPKKATPQISYPGTSHLP